MFLFVEPANLSVHSRILYHFEISIDQEEKCSDEKYETREFDE